MRTPLMNMETYIGFLEDGKEQMSEELFFQSVDALKNSQGKLGFLVESFIRMARLEQHVKRRAGGRLRAEVIVFTNERGILGATTGADDMLLYFTNRLRNR